MITTQSNEVVLDDRTGEVITAGGWLIAPCLGRASSSNHRHYTSITSLLEDVLINGISGVSSEYLRTKLAEQGVLVLSEADFIAPIPEVF